MAERLRKTHQEDVRNKIRTSQLLNRLTDHALSNEPILDTSQVRAIDIILKKVLPDLSSIEANHTGQISIADAILERRGKINAGG